MKPVTNELKAKIRLMVKNKLDISDLIQDVNINGADLSYAIITKFDRIRQTISNVNFSYATIGDMRRITNLSRSKFYNCIFCYTKFIGIIYLRHAYCKDCNFNCAYLPDVEYQYSVFENCTFCESVLRIGTDYGYKAIFDKNLFKDLSKHWGVEVRKREDKNE
jgi:uncharacterized protein YjbI with pentapeptide repeats